MTDQTECRPGTIARIPLPIGLYDLENALEPTHGDGRRVIGHGDHLDVFVPEDEEPSPSTSLTIPGDPKMIREALCVAEGATLRNVDKQNLHGAREVLGALIQECDRHRPLGPDGKHGQLHTATCGCDDVPERYRVAEAAQDGQERPGSASGDAGACGGGCEAAGALRRQLDEAQAGLLIAVNGTLPLVKRADKADTAVARVQKIVPTLRKIWAGEGKDMGQVIDAVEELIGQALDGGTGATR